MANVEQCWQGIVDSISTAMTAANLKPLLGVDWPNINILQAVATGQSGPVISVFDQGGTKNITKAMILNPCLPLNYGTPGGTLTPSTDVVGNAQSVHFTGSGTVLVNDAFFVAFTQWSDQFFAEYICNSTDTLTTALTGLTAAINTIEGFTAALSGDVITVINNSGQNLPVRSSVFNVGSYSQEIYRQERDIKITLWTKTPDDRRTYGIVLEQLFAIQESTYGIQLADQSWCRIMIKSDYVCKDSQLQDLFRRDFNLSCNYPVLQVLPAWRIAALHYVYSPFE